MSPELSVVIPVFNRPKEILECVGALVECRTNVPSMEVVIVDDGSTDEAMTQVLQTLPAWVRVYRQEKKGPNAARNLGASKARGRYLAFVDSDDLPRPNWGAVLLHLADESTAPVVCCAAAIQRRGGDISVSVPTKRGPVLRGAKLSYMAGCFCVEKGLFNAIGGYDESLASSHQMDLAIRIVESIHGVRRIACTDEVLIEIRDHGGVRIRNDDERVYKGTDQLLKKHHVAFLRDRDAKSWAEGTAGIRAYRAGLTTESRRLLATSFRTRPHPKSLARLLLSFAPQFLKNFVWGDSASL